MWYVYILQSNKDGTIYVGITNNLKKRLVLHNAGKIWGTHHRLPYIPIYYEAHCNKKDAAARERFLKTGWGKNWIRRTLKNYFESKSWEDKAAVAQVVEHATENRRVGSASLPRGTKKRE